MYDIASLQKESSEFKKMKLPDQHKTKKAALTSSLFISEL